MGRAKTEFRKGDREKMASAIFDLVAQYRTLQVCYDQRARRQSLRLIVTGPYALRLGVKLAARPDNMVDLVWKLRPYFRGERVGFSDAFHSRVAIVVDYANRGRARLRVSGFRALYDTLVAAFDLIDSGRAFRVEGPLGLYAPPHWFLKPAPAPEPSRLTPPQGKAVEAVPNVKAQVLATMLAAWDAGEPWNKSPQSGERRAIRRMVIDFGVAAEQASKWLSDWQRTGVIAHRQVNSHTKKKGFCVLVSPEIAEPPKKAMKKRRRLKFKTERSRYV